MGKLLGHSRTDWSISAHTHARASLKYNQQDATFSRSVYFYKLLYMFQTVPPPIIKSTKPYIQRQALSNQYCRLLLPWKRWNGWKRWNSVPSLPRWQQAAVQVWQYLTLYVRFCALDDGRKNRQKHVEQFIAINRSRKHCILLVVL
jgi:hypothetical protein